MFISVTKEGIADETILQYEGKRIANTSVEKGKSCYSVNACIFAAGAIIAVGAAATFLITTGGTCNSNNICSCNVNVVFYIL